jgi:mycothiol system anti-sigma-R factor
MVCDDVKRVVYFFLDGSLGQKKLLEFESHLQICRDCDGRTTISRKLRDFVRRRLSATPAPEHLKVRLTQTLRTVRVD